MLLGFNANLNVFNKTPYCDIQNGFIVVASALHKWDAPEFKIQIRHPPHSFHIITIKLDHGAV